jgi:hypothetical protein
VVFPACGGGDSTTPNQTDQASATIGPSGGAVVTPSGAAGVQIPAGAVSQPVVVTVTSIATPTSVGSGPLPTTLKQYPPFYEFQTSPANAQFGDSVRVGVCQVTDPSSQYYAPESDHPKLRLAHTVGAGVEVLKPVAVNDFLRCTGITAKRSGGLLSRFAAALGVSPAYAAHGGLGGKVKSFSPFGAVLDACVDTATATIGGTLSGAIESTDCPVPIEGGSVVDWARFTLAAQTTFSITSTGNNIAVGMLMTLGPINPDNLVFDYDVPSTNYAIVPPGDYLIGVFGPPNGGRRPYTVQLQNATLSGCTTNQAPPGPTVMLAPGTVYNGAITNSDCTGSQPNIFVDHYEVQLLAGKSYIISASGTGLALEVGIPTNGNLNVVASANNPNGSVSLTFVPQSTQFYVVNVIGSPPGRTGPYTLRISRPN